MRLLVRKMFGPLPRRFHFSPRPPPLTSLKRKRISRSGSTRADRAAPRESDWNPPHFPRLFYSTILACSFCRFFFLFLPFLTRTRLAPRNRRPANQTRRPTAISFSVTHVQFKLYIFNRGVDMGLGPGSTQIR